MITVSSFLLKRAFSTFRLISGSGGINNIVLATGFFEWENEAEIHTAFIEGSFVLTTLSMFKDNVRDAERYLKLMINNHVAAIAIKDVFFSSISEELSQYADKHNVPIFVFSNTYINDIMRIIQNEVSDDMNYSLNSSVLEMVIKNKELSDADKRTLLNKVNPLFRDGGISALYISNGNAENLSVSNLSSLYQDAIDELKNIIGDIQKNDDIIYSIILYKRGFFLLLAHKDDDERAQKRYLHNLVKKIDISREFLNLFVGISTVSQGVQIEQCLKSAIFANTSGVLDDKGSREFCDIGIDAVIFDHIKSTATCKYINQITEVITEAESSNTPFMETILAYVACCGNIERTSNVLHQHRNTVRYRIDKIRKLFGDEDEITFVGKLFYFTRVYRAQPYLTKLI